MKITIFTSNQTRHNYFINLLSKVADKIYVIQECNTIFPGENNGHYAISNPIKNYFKKVQKAQDKIFGKTFINLTNKKILIFPIRAGDLNLCSLNYLSEFLQSDYYIVFGTSYIKGDLIDFLVKKRAINIHMGVSPYYRGTDCNFWALFDGNPHLVGSTVHLISKGLDNGPILYHALSRTKQNLFEYSMSATKAAFHSVADRIKDRSINKIESINQDKKKQIRYSKKIDFNECVIKEFFDKKISLKNLDFSKSLLKDPFYLK